MRISDWSSDVCSSDLHQRAADEIGDLLLVRFDPVDAAFGETGHAHGQEMDRAQHVGADQRHEDVEFELALHPADRDRLVVADHLRRSVEHTSELQLLMRILYALFCFKNNLPFLTIPTTKLSIF